MKGQMMWLLEKFPHWSINGKTGGGEMFTQISTQWCDMILVDHVHVDQMTRVQHGCSMILLLGGDISKIIQRDMVIKWSEISKRNTARIQRRRQLLLHIYSLFIVKHAIANDCNCLHVLGFYYEFKAHNPLICIGYKL